MLTKLKQSRIAGAKAGILAVTMVRASEPHQRWQNKLVKRERDDRQLPRARVASVAGQKLLLRIYVIPKQPARCERSELL